MMITDEIVETSCPLCNSACFLLETCDCDGGITTSYSYDYRLLCDPEDAFFTENGSDVPNTTNSGGH